MGPLGNSKVKPFDATVLLRSFQTSMVGLRELAEKNERRVEKLEQVCSKQQREHAVKLKDLEGIYAVRTLVDVSSTPHTHMYSS